MEYEWDAAKDAENRRKHRLSLADGIPALEDPDAESWIDTRFDYSEERIVTLGVIAHPSCSRRERGSGNFPALRV